MSTHEGKSFLLDFGSILGKDLIRTFRQLRIPLIFAGGVLAGSLLMFITLIAVLRTDPEVPASVSQALPDHGWSDVISLSLLLVVGLAFWCGTLLKGPAGQ